MEAHELVFAGVILALGRWGARWRGGGFVRRGRRNRDRVYAYHAYLDLLTAS